MKDINLNLIESFFSVYRLGNHSKAARELNITAASVVNHINKLEDILGEKLFVKVNSTLMPTKEAFSVYQKTFHHFKSLKFELDNFNPNKSEFEFDIITSTGASLIWLVSLISDFQNRNPNFIFRIHTTEDLRVNINDYDIIALPQNLNVSEYKKVHVASFISRLYASKAYLEKFGKPSSAKDLDNHRIIAFYHRNEGNRGDLDWILRIGRKKSAPRIPSLIINNAMGIGEAVKSGLGIAALPDNNPYIYFEDVVQVLPELKSLPAHLYISYDVKLGSNKFIKELLKFSKMSDKEDAIQKGE